MNRTLRLLTAGALLAVLAACTAGAPTGATLPPLTTSSATASESVPSIAPSTPTAESTPSETVLSETVGTTPSVEVVVPAEASALPLPTEQIDIPADNPQEEADRAAIEAVWRQVWDLYRDGYEMNADQVKEVAGKLMLEPVRSLFVDGISAGQQNGQTSQGSITVYPYWYRSTGGLPYAVMGDCADFSNYGVVTAGSNTPASQGKANLNTAGYFIKNASGDWQLWQISNIESVSCSPR